MVDIWNTNWTRQMGSRTTMRWNTAMTRGEGGSIQRRNRWLTPVRQFTLQYNAMQLNDVGALSDGRMGEMWLFFMGQHGAYGGFYYKDTKDYQATQVTLSGNGSVQTGLTSDNGTTATAIKDAAVFTVDDAYNTWYKIRFTSGPANGQERYITDVNGSTGVATVESAFSPAPTAAGGDTYSLVRGKWQLRQNYAYKSDGGSGTTNNYYDKKYIVASSQTIQVADGAGGWDTQTVTTHYNIDNNTGIITVVGYTGAGDDVPDGRAVRATFQYYFKVHFLNDEMSYEEFTVGAASGQLILEELKEA